jgi:hypothetical protein
MRPHHRKLAERRFNIVHISCSGGRDQVKKAQWNRNKSSGRRHPGPETGDLPDGTHNGRGIAAGRCGAPGYFGPGTKPEPIHHSVFEFYELDTKLELPAITARDG